MPVDPKPKPPPPPDEEGKSVKKPKKVKK